MSLTYSADSDASPEVLWALVSRPSLWSRWAPHIRGAWNLGSPEVQVGRRGAARLLGFVPIPALVSAKEAGRSWTWKVGPLAIDHAVEPLDEGSRVSMTMSAPATLEPALAVSYGPVVALLVRRLARVAAESPAD